MNLEPAPSSTVDATPIVRVAQEGESVRARQLFMASPEQPPLNASFLVALKPHPVERIVATLAWWREEMTVKFLVARKPAVSAEQAAAVLVPALEALPGLGEQDVEFGRLLAENEEVAPWLARHGYQTSRTERVFEAPCATVYQRLQLMLARQGREIPATWSTESIRHHLPETVWSLIAPFRLIKLESLRSFWAMPGERGYHPEFSNILFDAGTPLGVLLVRSDSVCLAVDVRVVKPITRRLRSLANLLMFGHIQRVVTPTTWRILAFRGDEIEHRETANLARRMGGREVAARHIYIRHADSRGVTGERPQGP